MKIKKGSPADRILNMVENGAYAHEVAEEVEKLLSNKNTQIKNLKKKVQDTANHYLADEDAYKGQIDGLQDRLTLSKIAAQRAMTEKQFKNYLKILGTIKIDDRTGFTQEGLVLSDKGIMFFKLGLQAKEYGKWFAITKLGCEDNHFDQKTATEILNYFKTLPEYQLVMEDRTYKTREEALKSKENRPFTGEEDEVDEEATE